MGNDTEHLKLSKKYTERNRTENCIKSAQAHARLAHSATQGTMFQNRTHFSNIPDYYIVYIWSYSTFKIRSIFNVNVYTPGAPAKMYDICTEMNDVLRGCLRDKETTETEI